MVDGADWVAWTARAEAFLLEKTGAKTNRMALENLLARKSGAWEIVEIMAQYAAVAYLEGVADNE